MFARFYLYCLLTVFVPVAAADSTAEIDANADKALAHLLDYAQGADELLGKAAGVLIFPDVVKMGFGVGGQYVEGVLRVNNKASSYYSTAGASFGLQLGAQFKSEVIVFLTEDSLQSFIHSQGWEVGVDGSVALIELGAGGKIDSREISAPVIGFVFSNKGLMYNLTLEGSKITRLAR